MPRIKLLLFGCLFQLSILLKIETIKYPNPTEIKELINSKKVYEIKFDSIDSIPNYLQINLSSSNNIWQIVSFSSMNQNCQNGIKYRSVKNDLYIEKSQLSLEKNFICIECENPKEYCEFTLSLTSGKLGMKMEEEKIFKINNYLVNEPKGNEYDNKIMISKDLTIDLYTLNSNYGDALKIPSNLNKIYKIDSGTSGKYKIISGNSVTVGADGIIYPKNQTWYCHQGTFYSCSSSPGPNYEIVEIDYTLGTSIVQATVNDKAYKITVNVLDYATIYVDGKLDEYIKSNITNKKTQLDKYKAIAAYPAQFPYSPKYSGCNTMVIFGGGDCWASTSTILRLCDKVGIKAHGRSANRDSGAGGGHMNVIALIEGKYYIAEAGYGYEYPNRPYHVYEEPLGYSTKYHSKDNIVIYQYDGYDLDIKIPSSIEGKNVVGLDGTVFLGPSKNATNIKIPNSVTFLGNSVFSSLLQLEKIKITKNIESIGIGVFYRSEKLKKIEVESGNKNFSEKEGILFNKNKSILINYPPGKEANYTAPSSVEKFENYSFYYVPKVISIVAPKKTKEIGSFAFAYSSIKEIYYSGNPPIFGNNIYYQLNVSIYYPEGNKKWENVTNSSLTYGARAVRYYTWKPTNSEKKNNNFALTIGIISGVIILIVAAFLGFIYYKKKSSTSSLSLNVDLSFKKLLNKN